jgi:hypothetical protein
MSNMRERRRPGFALRDLVVIVFLTVIAIGVLLAAIQKTPDTSALRASMNSLSQCAKAVHLAYDNNKKLPPYFGTYAAMAVGPVPSSL